MSSRENHAAVKAMYGAIIGDVVGSVYEFNNIKEKDFKIFPPKAFFTDDTVMTLAIADALLNNAERSDRGGPFWLNITDEQWRTDFTRSMRQIGRHYPCCGYGRKFFDWVFTDGAPAYRSSGNGSAMRVSPVAYFAWTLEDCERLARLSSEVSHDHPDGIAGAQATAGAVYLALNGATKDEIKAYVEQYYKIDFTLDEIRPAYTFDHFAALCAGTVPYAVEAFLESTSFEDCLRNTISIGGDSDTLAAISCAIAEAYYGVPLQLKRGVISYLSKELRQIMFALDHIGRGF